MSERYSANLPSVGLTSFLRAPVVEDFGKVDAEVAFLGVPYDGGNGWRPGTRFGPREIRNLSARYGAWGGHSANGYWDVKDRTRYLDGIRMVDCGDVDVAFYDWERNSRLITSSVEAILDRGALPVIIGGDHSVSYPNVQALSRFGTIDIIHIDAHMDWRDEIAGVNQANAMPLRRIKELPFVRNMVQIGIRDVRTTADQVKDAEAAGAVIITRDDVRDEGVKGALQRFPELGDVFVSIDIDGLDPSIAPGTGSPTPDGLLYHEVRGLLKGVATAGNVVGFDLVEVNPMVDQGGRTCLLASVLILEFLGMIFANRKPSST